LIALALGPMAMVARRLGNYSLAEARIEESLALTREIGSTTGTARGLTFLGQIAALEGQHERAGSLFREALSLWAGLGNRPYLARVLIGLAAVNAADGQPEAAARLFGAAEMADKGVREMELPDLRSFLDRVWASVSDTLGEAASSAALAEGRRMPLDHAVAYALEQPSTTPEPEPVTYPPPAPAASSYPAGLTDREVEVLRLVSQGLTSARIAEQLVISPATVNTHLRNIYDKLGVSSRAAAARFAVEHGLA
jgi:DNA-binding CsgD family transcriptional regulator